MSGLEILAIVGFALSTPGVAVAISQCGQYLKDKIEAFKNAPREIESFKLFAKDLHDGEMKTYWELAERVSTEDTTDPKIRQSFEGDLARLKVLLVNIDQFLDRTMGANGLKGMARLTSKSDMKKLKKDIEDWKAEFLRSIIIHDIGKRLLPSPFLLTKDHFTPISSGPNNEYARQLQGMSHVWLASGELKNSDGTISEVSVLIEKWTQEKFPASGDLKHTAALLARGGSSDPSFTGILDCLGYCENQFQLVFRVPENLTHPQSLRALLNEDLENGYGGGHSLNDRLHLAYQLAESVLSVHLAGLVHKNIRSDTVLLFKEKKFEEDPNSKPNSSTGLPFLTEWSLLRQATGLSTRWVGDGEWMEEIYRHPGRQSGGIQPKARYNMGHDVYSLGVCLLEIGLWAPFIVGSCVSEVYRATAIRLGVEVEANGKLAQPLGVQSIFVAIARQELPPRMGMQFMDLVVSCLTCLEGGFSGDTHIFEGDAAKVAVGYKDAVLSPLLSISF